MNKAKRLSVDAAHELSIIFGEHKGGTWAPRNPEALVLGVKGKPVDDLATKAGLFDKLVEAVKGFVTGKDDDDAGNYDKMASLLGSTYCDLQQAGGISDPDARAAAMTKVLDNHKKQYDSFNDSEKAGKRHSAQDQAHLDGIAAEHAKQLKNTAAFAKSTEAIGNHLAALSNVDPANANDPDDEDGDLTRTNGDPTNGDDNSATRKSADAPGTTDPSKPEGAVPVPASGAGSLPVINKLYPSDTEADSGHTQESRDEVTVMDVPDNFKWPNGFKALPKEIAEDGTVKSWTLKADPEGQYGDVEYADTKNKKYPVDTKEHAKAAWSYINMPKNADKYESGELSTIKSKIKAACEKFGIEIGDDSSKSGEVDMTQEQIDALVAKASEAAAKAAVEAFTASKAAEVATAEAAVKAAEQAVADAQKAQADAEAATNAAARTPGSPSGGSQKGADGLTSLQRAVKAANSGSVNSVI